MDKMTISPHAFQVRNVGVYDAPMEPVALHQHPHVEIVVVTQGQCLIEIPDLHWSARGMSGSCFILPAQLAHNQENYANIRTIYLTSPSIEHFMNCDPQCIDLGADKQRIIRWLEDLYELFLEDDPAAHALCQSICMRIASLLGQQQLQQRLHPVLQQAIELLTTGEQGILENQAIADQIHVSPSYLLALFRKEFNMGPRAWQIHQRMKKAEQLLKDPYLNIDQVARRCGYNDALYFSRQFKKHAGISPSQWRKD